MSRYRLADIFRGDRVARFIGAHNGLTARLAERAGFDGIWASGLEISTAAALPDANILSMSEFLQASKQMRRASSLPILSDCDTGFGNSNNVIHMVREYEAAGIDGVCIEDKTFPKTNSFIGHGQVLAPVAEFVGKILAAKKAQTDPGFAVVARVEALIAGLGQEEAMRRASAYAEAGADAILMHSKSSSPDEAMTFLEAWGARTPVVLVPTTYPDLDVAAAEALGCRLIIYANHGLRSTVTSVAATFDRIRADGHTKDVEPDIAPLKTIFELQGMPDLKELELKYQASNFQLPVSILAAGAKSGDASLAPLLEDRPLPMLDLGGESLLELQGRIFHKAGLGRVTVVTGYLGDRVRLPGARQVANEGWDRCGSAGSAARLGADRGEHLLAYGDVLVHAEVVRGLSSMSDDIVLLVDSTVRDKSGKAIEHVRTTVEPGDREIGLGREAEVTEIGRDLEGNGLGEFAGLVKFSKRGWERFHAAVSDNPDLAGAAVIDVLEELRKQGTTLKAMVVSRGWSEIHSYDDYRRAAEHLDDWRT